MGWGSDRALLWVEELHDADVGDVPVIKLGMWRGSVKVEVESVEVYSRTEVARHMLNRILTFGTASASTATRLFESSTQ